MLFLQEIFKIPSLCKMLQQNLHISSSSDGMTIHFELAPMVTTTLRSPESHLAHTQDWKGCVCSFAVEETEHKLDSMQGVSPQHYPPFS